MMDDLNKRELSIIEAAIENGAVFACSYDESKMFGQYDYIYAQLERLIDAGYLQRHGWGDVIRSRYIATEKAMALLNSDNSPSLRDNPPAATDTDL